MHSDVRNGLLESPSASSFEVLQTLWQMALSLSSATTLAPCSHPKNELRAVGQFMGLDVIDSEGAHHIVKLKDSLMLPMESKGRAKVRDAVRKRMGKPPKEGEARRRASRPRRTAR